MQNSHIEWTDHTENPFALPGGGFYCFKVSPGCTHCYAEIMARRIAGMRHRDFEPYTNRKKGEYPEIEVKTGMMDGWKHKKKPALRFVSSMTDAFGEFIPDHQIINMLDAMVAARLQTFQVLTKRAARALHMIDVYCQMRGIAALPRNIWIIFSVEDQKTAEERIPILYQVRCWIRGLSMEPLLGAVDLSKINGASIMDWIIVGGESGHKARIMRIGWLREIHKYCVEQNIPFFFKQHGEWIHESQFMTTMTDSKTIKYDRVEEPNRTDIYYRIGKVKTGGRLDLKLYREFPHYFDYKTRLPKRA